MKKLLVLLIIIGLVLTAAAYWVSPSSAFPGEREYTLQSVERGSMVDSVSATGLVQPEEVAVVSSELPGKVDDIYPEADFNRHVAPNQKLLELDKRLALGKLTEANVAVELAKADVTKAEAARYAAQLVLDYQRERLDKGAFRKDVDIAAAQLKATEAAIEVAEANVKKAKAAQDLAQLGLDLTTVRAPCAGTIIDKKVVLGQTISPLSGVPLFTIASDLKKLQVHVQVSESDIGKIQQGLKATFTVNAYSEDDEQFEGKVVQIRPAPTQLQGAVFYNTVIEVANRRDPVTQEWKLRPGMPASVDIIRREHTDVWKMPTAALNLQLDDPYKTEAAKAKLASRKDAPDWKPVWILDAGRKPWPVFVRVGGKNAAGETGIKDSHYNEVMEWDPELKPIPDPRNPESIPRVITVAPPASKPKFFERLNVKVF